MLSESEQQYILAEHQAGTPSQDIAKALDRSHTTVYWFLKRRGIQPNPIPELSVTVVNDPRGLFTKGATFEVLDLVFMLQFSELPDGLILAIGRNGRTKTAVVQSGRLIREDNRWLKGDSGGGYRWLPMR